MAHLMGTECHPTGTEPCPSLEQQVSSVELYSPFHSISNFNRQINNRHTEEAAR